MTKIWFLWCPFAHPLLYAFPSYSPRPICSLDPPFQLRSLSFSFPPHRSRPQLTPLAAYHISLARPARLPLSCPAYPSLARAHSPSPRSRAQPPSLCFSPSCACFRLRPPSLLRLVMCRAVPSSSLSLLHLVLHSPHPGRPMASTSICSPVPQTAHCSAPYTARSLRPYNRLHPPPTSAACTHSPRPRTADFQALQPPASNARAPKQSAPAPS